MIGKSNPKNLTAGAEPSTMLFESALVGKSAEVLEEDFAVSNMPAEVREREM